jgi:hypothetical protein
MKMIDFENYKNEASVKSILYGAHGLATDNNKHIDTHTHARLASLLLKATIVEAGSLDERVIHYQIMNNELFKEVYNKYNDTINFSQLNPETCTQIMHLIGVYTTKELHDEPIDCSVSIIDSIYKEEPSLGIYEPYVSSERKPNKIIRLLSAIKRIFVTEV